MFCAHKNSYLQLQTSVNPMLVNKAVRRAMRKTQFDPHDEIPPAQRLASMQPSLYAPCTDITRGCMGFERLGLRILNKNITSEDNAIKVQAIHTLKDQVQISENALFLINLNVVYKLIDLLTDPDPIVKEKVCLILSQLTNYYQGRKRILARPVAIDRLTFLCMRERKELRYAAAFCLRNLARYSAEDMIKNDKLVESLIKMIKNDHEGIVLLHIETLKKLAEWDPEKPLKAHAFKVMLKLMNYRHDRVKEAAMDCMRQLCKHSVGQKLADKYDLTHLLLMHLESEDVQVIISALGLMEYTSVTSMSKWRGKEFVYDLTTLLVVLCVTHDIPVLQIRAMQTLINLCDSPDIRNFVKNNLEKQIVKGIKIRKPEQWDGTTETDNYGLETGRNYRSRYTPKVETIKNDQNDHGEMVNVPNYLMRVKATKDHLLRILKYKSYKESDKV
ncbi:uncharacterized protein LOC110379651 [Helicoverpa armigera]|uniref:Uncharacterized protein n=1 Tax=Helicoverpa armigera TaxID=29058 RepID=A0A2W1BHV1_HELAM|nr:hypothetical protein B5X24_HaOG207870 [Helicoverpa armigera]